MTDTSTAPAGKHGLAISPVDAITLAAARFMVSMRGIEDAGRRDLANVDDLGSLDFFATHPLLVFEPGSGVHDELRRLGFRVTLDYMQPCASHAAHLEQARPALAMLLAKGCIEARIDKALTWAVTPRGAAISEQLAGEYFEAHARAAIEVLGLVPRQGTRWRELRESWLGGAARSTIERPGGQ